MEADHVDGILEQWARERPELDASPIGVVGRISRAARLLERGVDAELVRHGLDAGRFDVLAALRRRGAPFSATPTELAGALMLAKASATHRIDLLERDGLVVRGADPDDGRRLLVRLTARGRAAIDAAMAAHVENEARLLAHLDAVELEQLAGLLRALVGPLERR